MELAARGDSVALVEPDGSRVSYGALAKRVADAASAMARVRRLVFLFSRNDVNSVIALLGALAAGAPVALLDAGLDPTLKRKLIDAYLPEVLVGGVEPELAAAVGAVPTTSLLHPCCFERGAVAGPLHAELGLLLSTSGTTGSPKFVRLAASAVQANAASIAEALSIDATERAICSLPLHYSYGLSVLTSHLAVGGSVVFNPFGIVQAEFWRLARDTGCTSFAGVPTMYQMLRRLDFRALDVPALRVMTQAGGKLANELIEDFHARMIGRGGRFFVMYGQTEATARIAVLPPSLLPEKVGCVGCAIPGGTITIEDASGARVPPLTKGEIVYRGPNVMMGYARCRSDLGLGDQLGGVLKTGDTGYLDADGLLHVTGRSQRMAKIFGLRVDLDEIEALARVRAPAAAVAGSDCVVLYVERGHGVTPEELVRDLAATLRLHPRVFEASALDELPLLSNGKVDYEHLRRAGVS